MFRIVTLITLMFSVSSAWAQNQTEDLSPIFPESFLPFTLHIEQATFSLPTGIQAYVSAAYKGKWLLLAGRTNGLHGFSNVGNNFPPAAQNTDVYVVDSSTGAYSIRSLTDGNLSAQEIDSLSATASESFQKGETLYVVGGYGIDTASDLMGTKDILTAIDIPGMIGWVVNGGSLKGIIRQVSHPILRVTGGFLYQANDHEPFLMMLGQNFEGLYHTNSNGQYTMQIRPFWINDNGKNLSILAKQSSVTYPDYRRRDLNIVPIVQNNQFAYTAFAGVFTLAGGVWTVPITIYPDGSSFEPDVNNPNTFKQGMNHYNCPTLGLYSTRAKEMFVVFPGGISFGFFSGGVFSTDAEIPFINQVTTIKIDKSNQYSQYLMNGEYPFIASAGTNPGNQLLFGAEAQFFVRDGIALYSNGVIQLDKISGPTVVGHIVGGIMSTLPNTNDRTDSTSSPYVFTVTIIPKEST